MIDSIKNWWGNLTPENKKKVVISAIFGTVIVIGLSTYYLSGRAELAGQPVDTAKPHEIQFNTKMAEQAVMDDVNKKLATQEDRLRRLDDAQSKLQKENEELKSKLSGGIPINPLAHSSSGISQKGGAFPMPPDKKGGPSAPLSQRLTSGFNPASANSNVQVPPPPLPPSVSAGGVRPAVPGGNTLSVIGDISIVSNKNASDGDVKKNEKGEAVGSPGGKSDKGNKIKNVWYLPPGFMTATLLTGCRAPVTIGGQGGASGGDGNLPLLLRVKTPAVLPNRVSSSIQDCFIMASAKGNLADERVWVRTESLTCVGPNKKTIIETKIKGFVQDEDGMVGLSGIVTARFGAALARSLLAGAVGGAGDAIQQSSNTTYTSALGTTQSMDTKDIGKAALGGALSKSADQITAFYLDLARQSAPVIEVGASKPCTVIIQEGVNLEVKEVNIK